MHLLKHDILHVHLKQMDMQPNMNLSCGWSLHLVTGMVLHVFHLVTVIVLHTCLTSLHPEYIAVHPYQLVTYALADAFIDIMAAYNIIHVVVHGTHVTIICVFINVNVHLVSFLHCSKFFCIQSRDIESTSCHLHMKFSLVLSLS